MMQARAAATMDSIKLIFMPPMVASFAKRPEMEPSRTLYLPRLVRYI